MPETFAQVQVGSITIGGTVPPAIIAGPCVIESEDHALMLAEKIGQITAKAGFQFIFKASYDKANRTSIHSYRGPGLEQGLCILERIRRQVGVPILTDIHAVDQIGPVAEVVDMIQIPAFLCRQTDLYVEAGKYSVPVNVKKGQFMAPGDMENVVEKARQSGIQSLTLTERGASFGYNRLVVDFISLPLMRALNVPVVFDATHSLQLPGGGGTFSAGHREFVPHLCRAAAAVGCDALFLEVHDIPEKGLSDASNMVALDDLADILSDVRHISQIVRDGEQRSDR